MSVVVQPESSNILARLLFAVVLGSIPASTSGAPPANDLCANAIVIPADGPFPHFTEPVDVTEAATTGDPPVPSCQMDVSRSVWYLFRPSATDVYRFSTCGEFGVTNTIRDTVMAIYTNSPNTLNNACGAPFAEIENGCNDDYCNKNSEITRALTAGAIYYIVIWQYGFEAPAPSPGQGLAQLIVEQGRPANDDCSDPDNIQEVQLNVPVFGQTLYARNDYDFGNSTCFGAGHTAVDTPGLDVIFSFTAPASGKYSFRVKNYNLALEPDYDLVLYVSPVCPMPDPSGTMNDCLAAANRNLGSAEEIDCVALANSQRVYLFVDDRHPMNRGSTFTLEVTLCVPEIEPNGSIFNPQPYFFESTGTMDPLSETDYYALGTFTPGSRVFAIIDGISANGSDFNLWVVSSTETLEYDDRDNDIPYGQSSANVAGTPLTADCASLRLKYNGATAEPPYRLYAVVQPPLADAIAEIEPNNIPAQAQESPKNYFTGNLMNMIDEDLYAFDAVEGDLMHLGLDADPLRDRTPIDAQLELLNSAGGILMLVDKLSNTSNTNTVPGVIDALRPFSPAETIVARASYTGRYYARVSLSPFAPPGNVGNYLLSITRNGFPGAGATNTPPGIISLSAPPVPETTNAVLTATIVDPDAGPKFTVTVDWGDGSSISVLPLALCQYTFEATHQYPRDGLYPVTVAVYDIHGDFTSASTSIQVIDAAAPANVRSIQRQPNGSVLLQLRGTPNATYRIEISDNLQTWSHYADRPADASGDFQFLDAPPPPLPARRFYRAVWP